MRYFGKEIEVEKRRKIDYITCDKCNKKIEPKERYFFVDYSEYTGYDNYTRRKDICRDCIQEYTKELISGMGSNVCELSLNTKFYSENDFDKYDKYEDEIIE